MIGSILLVYALGFSARGSQRAIEFGFFNFQASELGKLLLVVALSAFVVDRMRRLDDRETTSRIVLLALIPAMLVVAQPDLGSGLVYLAIVLGAILFVAGTPWTHFAALGGLAAVAIVVVLVAAPAVGRRGAQAVPGGPPHGLPQPRREPRRGGLPDQPVADGDRLGRQDRPRRRGDPDEARLPARAPHGLRVLGGRRGVRLRGRGARAVAVRAPDLASTANPDDVRRTSTARWSPAASPRC